MPNDIREYDIWAQLNVYKRHIEKARAVLRRAAEKGRPLISTSWGKDSVFLCDLAIDTLGGDNVDLMHIGYPDDLPGYDRVIAYFEERANVFTVQCAQGWDEYLDWYNSTTSATQTQRKGARADKWIAENGYTIECLGIRANESSIRRRVLRRKGQLYQRKSGLWMCHPIGWCDVRDVWAWILSRGVPYHPMYDCETHGLDRQQIRNAGWLTTCAGSWLQAHYPEQWARLRDAMPWEAMSS